MKIGIMSFAHMHAFTYADCIACIDNAALMAVYDNDETRGKKAAEKFGVNYYHEMDEFLQLDLDAVIICSENSHHKDMTIKAARAKKHILCEKPIATTIEDAQEMIHVCEQEGVILQIAFPVRFSTSIAALKAMIDRGELGEILAIRSVNRGQCPSGWFTVPELSGGGAVLDHTVHMIDIMRWCLSKEIKEIYATVDRCFHEKDIDDAGLLTLTFENDIIASHDCSWSRFPTFPAWGDAAIEVFGTKKSAKADAFGEKLLVFNENDGRLKYEHTGNNIDLDLIRDFVECIEFKRQPSITGYDGLKALEAALAAYESNKNSSPVFLI
jgi:predicted dehydrogenase